MKIIKWAFFIWIGAAAFAGILAAFNDNSQTASAPVAKKASAPFANPTKTAAPSAEQKLRERRERGLNAMKAEFEQPERKGQIDPIALLPYTRSQFPETVSKYGKAIPALERDRAKAAKIAAAHPDCDVVQNVQVTTRSPKVNRRYWAECSNITRLYFDEASLAEGKAAKVQTVADMGRDGLADW